MKALNKFKELRRKYPLIVATGKMFGSYDYYVNSQLIEAAEINAPANTINIREGEARTTDDLCSIDYLKRLLNYL